MSDSKKIEYITVKYQYGITGFLYIVSVIQKSFERIIGEEIFCAPVYSCIIFTSSNMQVTNNENLFSIRIVFYRIG